VERLSLAEHRSRTVEPGFWLATISGSRRTNRTRFCERDVHVARGEARVLGGAVVVDLRDQRAAVLRQADRARQAA